MLEEETLPYSYTPDSIFRPTGPHFQCYTQPELAFTIPFNWSPVHFFFNLFLLISQLTYPNPN